MAADSLHHNDYDWKWHSRARSSCVVIRPERPAGLKAAARGGDHHA
jgi:hypothetical protein